VKLREVGFKFVVDRDAGHNKWKWLDMYADLSVFYGVYGHSQLSKNHNLKLYCWLCTQKHVLSQSTLLLSPTKVKCHELLLHLGIKF
jgi:hypothetical protein